MSILQKETQTPRSQSEQSESFLFASFAIFCSTLRGLWAKAARACLAGLLLLSAGAAGAAPLSLQVNITNLADGDKVGTNFVLQGWAYNAAAEGAFTSATDLIQVSVPETDGEETVDLRLRAIGSDLSVVEKRISVKVKPIHGSIYLAH